MGTVKRASGRYYSRVVVPFELREVVGKRELVRSLFTGSKSVAAARAAAIEAQWREGLLAVKKAKKVMDEVKLKELVAQYFREGVEDGEQWHLLHGPSSNLDGRLSDLQDHAGDLRQALALNDFRSLPPQKVADLLGVDLAELPQESYRKLCREILTAQLAMAERGMARMNGEPETEPWHVSPHAPALHALQPVAPETPTMLLSEAIRQFTALKTAEGAWGTKTALEGRLALADLLQIAGDRPVGSLTKADLADYWSVLLHLPPNPAKRYPGVALRELAARGLPRVAPATANKAASFTRSLFAWLDKQDQITGKNPAAALGKARVDAAQEQRQAFSDADLRVIFGDTFKADSRGRAERHWIPLLLALTGARLEEVAQLHKSDIREVDGVWCMDVNTLDGKQLKTAQSRRVVPLHSRLLALGFLEYVAAAPDGHLWPALQRSSNGYGGAISKWFNLRQKRLGFGRGQVLHSLRHTFATRLKEADVQDHAISELVGHKVEGMTMGRYGKRLSVPSLKAAVEKLRLPV